VKWWFLTSGRNSHEKKPQGSSKYSERIQHDAERFFELQNLEEIRHKKNPQGSSM
jgi:hypothetical protein